MTRTETAISMDSSDRTSRNFRLFSSRTSERKWMGCSVGRQRQSRLLLALGIVLVNQSTFGVTKTTTSAKSFPGQLPKAPPAGSSPATSVNFWWSDGGSSDDDTDAEGSDTEIIEKEQYLATNEDAAQEMENPELGGRPRKNASTRQRAESYSQSRESATGRSERYNQRSAPVPDPSPPQSLQTLRKLQHMLDETDYMTGKPDGRKERQAPRASSSPQNAVPSNSQNLGPQEPDKLWTSKDRGKYKKQQKRMLKAQQENSQRAPPPPPPPPPVFHQEYVDEETSDDVDDGLEYALPNLPVYLSDNEGESDTDTESRGVLPAPAGANNYGNYGYPPPPHLYPQLSQEQYMQMAQQHYNYMYAQQQQQQSNELPYHTYPPPYPAQQQQMYPPGRQQHYAVKPPKYGTVPRASRPSTRMRVEKSIGVARPKNLETSSTTVESKKTSSGTRQALEHSSQFPAVATQSMDFAHAPPSIESLQTLAEASSKLNFESVLKSSLLLVTMALVSYSAVSPRTLPLTEYNLRFFENLKLLALSALVPAINMLSVFNARENDINNVVNTFFISYTLGYGAIFVVEIVVTTLVRLAVFCWLDRGIFALAPNTPVPVLPWLLRENRYRPKRITLFAADLLTSCVACPIIEEYAKLRLLEWTVNLPRNFKQVTKTTLKGKKVQVMEPIPRGMNKDVVSATQHVTYMLAASLGIKMADVGRRILLYTKPYNDNKSFYALFRGIFPIHELCGTMTALALAKRDLIGMKIPLWKMLLPGVFIHGVVNFRGMKPIFKWNSATPWAEMQLSPLNIADSSTFPQLLQKGFAKLMLFIFLSRVLGYCIKNYYMINRQALKRTTRNHAAFSGELVTAELLKKNN